MSCPLVRGLQERYIICDSVERCDYEITSPSKPIDHAPNGDNFLTLDTIMTFEASIIIALLNQIDSWLEQSVRSAVTQSIPTEVVVVRSEFTSPSNQIVLKSGNIIT